jgi:DnaK suppressor protein
VRTRDIERFRDRLLSERDRLKEALAKRGEAIRREPGGESGENVYSDHMADMALSESEGTTQALHSHREWALLKEVEAALGRIRQRSFGRCMSCGKPVEMERLNLVPHARFCTKCK